MREAGLKGLLLLHSLKSAGENKTKPKDCCQISVEEVPTYTCVYYIYLNVLAEMIQSEGKWLMLCVWLLPSDAVFPFTTAYQGQQGILLLFLEN